MSRKTPLRSPVPDPVGSSRRDRILGPLNAMGLGAIGDFGSAPMTQIQEETITWETSTDWDNAVAEEFVSHSNDVVSMIAGMDDWEDQASGNSPPNPWTNNGGLQISNNRGYNSSLSLHGNGNSTTRGVETSFPNAQPTSEVRFLYNETTNQYGLGMGLLNENGNVIVEFASGNPQRGFTAGYEWEQEDDGYGDPSPSYDEWYGWRIYDWDWTNETFTLEWYDFSGSGNSTITKTGVGFRNSSNAIGGAWFGGAIVNNYDNWGTGDGSDTYWDLCYGVLYESYLTSATKSFSSSGTPDLQNLDYTLNGQNITLDVIGSPGTSSEEIVSQTLDGATSYSLSWTNSHTDFRVRLNLDSPDRDTSPTVSRVELVSK